MLRLARITGILVVLLAVLAASSSAASPAFPPRIDLPAGGRPRASDLQRLDVLREQHRERRHLLG